MAFDETEFLSEELGEGFIVFDRKGSILIQSEGMIVEISPLNHTFVEVDGECKQVEYEKLKKIFIALEAVAKIKEKQKKPEQKYYLKLIIPKIVSKKVSYYYDFFLNKTVNGFGIEEKDYYGDYKPQLFTETEIENIDISGFEKIKEGDL